MTNPHSQAEPNSPIPAEAAVPGSPSGRSPRKGPRRATAPAGAPAKSATPAPVLLLIGADGMIVPGPGVEVEDVNSDAETGTETNDAGQSPAASSPPPAAVEVGDVDASAEESLIEDSLVSAEGHEAAIVSEAGAEKSEDQSATEESPSDVLDVEPAEESEESAAATDAATADADAPTEATEATEATESAEDIEPSDVPEIEPADASAPSSESETSGASGVSGESLPDSTPVEPDTQESEDSAAATDAAVADDDAPTEATEATESADDIEPSDVPEIEPADASAPSSESETSGASEESLLPLLIEGESEESANDSAPMSRRERRLAEQKSDAEPSTAVPATETAPVLTSMEVSEAESPKLATSKSTSKSTSDAKPAAKKRNRLLAFLKAFLFMVVIVAIVVGMGTVLAGKDDAALAQSQTELNRQAAWDRTNTLMGQASTLASSAATPKVAEILNQTATDLATQSAALSDGLPPSTSTVTAAATESPVSLDGFIVALNSSGDELLKSALSAEQAMGRVFAAAGTSQLVLAQSLSSAAGSTPPSSDFLPARVTFAAPEGPECKSALDPRPGATIDSALRAAALGEQKAIYAYQVATTRLSEPQFSKSEALLARHENKLKVLNEELRVRCLPLAAPVAGFTLDGQFTTAPAAALSGLESELARIYADLAALSTAPSGETAGTAAPQAPADGKTPSNITELREISVTWLLDSTQSQNFWGGSVGALAGMPDA